MSPVPGATHYKVIERRRKNVLDQTRCGSYTCIMTQTSKCKPAGMSRRKCCERVGGLLDPRFFRALCDPNRVAILARLAGSVEPCTVSGINECCPIDISVVSRHLGVLRDAGILRSEKRGKEVYYSVRYDHLVETLRGIADAMEGCCPNKSSSEEKTSGNT